VATAGRRPRRSRSSASRAGALRVALVANPESGGRTDRRSLEAELRSAGAEVVCFDLEQLADAAACGVDRLVVAGGDGMLGPAAEAARAAGVPFALIPTGTANDFARGMGLSLDPVEACRVAVRGGRTRTLDLAHMDGRPFVNTASVGLSANAADRAIPLKKVIGRFAYMFGAVWAGFSESPVRCRVTCDDEELFSGKAWQVIVANSGRFGAGSSVEEADPGDGLLDATVIPAGSRVKLPRYAYAMRRGRISSAGEARHGRGCRVRLEVPRAEPYNVDGELVCHGSADFRVERAAARIVLS
jgi:diacylglycerol kinase (ATP)